MEGIIGGDKEIRAKYIGEGRNKEGKLLIVYPGKSYKIYNVSDNIKLN